MGHLSVESGCACMDAAVASGTWDVGDEGRLRPVCGLERSVGVEA